MTFAIGWKYGKSVYLVADSAVSGIPSRIDLLSSFNERHGIGAKGVQEATLKLAIVGPGAAMTYAGSTQIASRVITFMRSTFDADLSPETAFDLARRSVGPFSDDQRDSASFLLARSYPDGTMSLTYWDTFERQPEEVQSLRVLGNLPVNGPEREAAIKIVRKFESERTDESSMLPRVTSAVQSFGQNDADLLSRGVGGIFWGLRTTAGSVHWQPRTLYLIDSSENATRPMSVLAFISHDVLVVLSEYTKTYRAFPFIFDTGKPISEMVAEAAKECVFPPDWNSWLCLVNLIKGRRRVIVVCRDSMDSPSRHITFEPGKGSQLHFGAFFEARKIKVAADAMLMTLIRE